MIRLDDIEKKAFAQPPENSIATNSRGLILLFWSFFAYIDHCILFASFMDSLHA